jgi:hypothetical protein
MTLLSAEDEAQLNFAILDYLKSKGFVKTCASFIEFECRTTTEERLLQQVCGTMQTQSNGRESLSTTLLIILFIYKKRSVMTLSNNQIIKHQPVVSLTSRANMRNDIVAPLTSRRCVKLIRRSSSSLFCCFGAQIQTISMKCILRRSA